MGYKSAPVTESRQGLNSRLEDWGSNEKKAREESRGRAAGSDMTISQADLDSLMRSKAAMYTTITASVGITSQDLGSFYVAGTFGSFINPESAIAIGMLPDLPLDRYKPLGNSSLGGAALALQSDKTHDEIDQIRDRFTYLELNVNQDFMIRFSAAKFLPHTNTKLFPSVKVVKKIKYGHLT